MDILTNKQYRQYDYFSRYASFPYYYHTIDKKYIYGTASQLKDSTSYILHKVARNDTLDILALHYYNNPTLFWVIADFNHIQDPYQPLEVNTDIKIPMISQVSFEE